MAGVSQVGGVAFGDLKQMIRENKAAADADGVKGAVLDNLFIKQGQLLVFPYLFHFPV